jgi:hypothetical protein
MTISKWTFGGIVGVALLLGLAFGRFGLPSKVIERDHIVTTDREVSSTWHAYVGRSETHTEQQTKWQTVTRWEKDGSVVQTVQAQSDTKTDQVTQVSDQTSTKKEIEQKREEIHERIVESKKPDWLIGAGAGFNIEQRVPIYKAEVDRRIIGPVFLGVSAQYPVAVLAEVKLLF